jgi:hypothetical protein
MNIADVLRKVADAIEEEQQDSNGTTESGNARAPDVFLPPLQQKQELLKKAVGVDNVYDDGTATEQAEVEEFDNCEQDRTDIVDHIKKLSGIPTAAVFGLVDDEPLDN